jgi:dTDP-4-amino-4,6-dideoxygalactose transaminase
MADMDPILEIAQKHGLKVLEDAAQSQGAEYKGHRAGSMGNIGCFSFYPGKNLGAYGEAGAVVTNDDDLAKYMSQFRDHGQAKKYYHDIIGWNARMDGFQGAILAIKMKYIEAWTEARRSHAATYNRLLDGAANIIAPVEKDSNRHVYHIYAVLTENRDEVMDKLKEKGVASGIHYPIPLHLQKAYAGLGYKVGDFPHAEHNAARQISMPMFPELSEEQVTYAAETLKTICA